MKPNEIEPGMLLRGPVGQTREVVRIVGTRTQYRLISAGCTRTKPAPAPESLRWCDLQTLASWALEEITERQAS